MPSPSPASVVLHCSKHWMVIYQPTRVVHVPVCLIFSLLARTLVLLWSNLESHPTSQIPRNQLKTKDSLEHLVLQFCLLRFDRAHSSSQSLLVTQEATSTLTEPDYCKDVDMFLPLWSCPAMCVTLWAADMGHYFQLIQRMSRWLQSFVCPNNEPFNLQYAKLISYQ